PSPTLFRPPHLEHDPLHPPGLAVQNLARVPGAATGFQPVGVGRGMLDVPPAHAADVAMSARPDAPPIPATPVQLVVPASGGRTTGPVRHLVPTEAGSLQRLVGRGVPLGEDVVVERGQLTAADPGGEAGSLLDDQRV